MVYVWLVILRTSYTQHTMVEIKQPAHRTTERTQHSTNHLAQPTSQFTYTLNQIILFRIRNYLWMNSVWHLKPSALENLLVRYFSLLFCLCVCVRFFLRFNFCAIFGVFVIVVLNLRRQQEVFVMKVFSLSLNKCHQFNWKKNTYHTKWKIAT